MTLLHRVCQNCFREINKESIGSNFCCQQCFDEWILKQQSKVIKAFGNIIFADTEARIVSLLRSK